MLKIDCSKCRRNCCGEIPCLSPVLLPSEQCRFRQHSRVVRTKFGEMRVLGRKRGYCVFYDRRARRCAAYGRRPLECRLYPFLLDFSKKQVSVRLDRRFCPALRTLQADRKRMIALVRRRRFPADWIAAYKTMIGY